MAMRKYFIPTILAICVSIANAEYIVISNTPNKEAHNKKIAEKSYCGYYIYSIFSGYGKAMYLYEDLQARGMNPILINTTEHDIIRRSCIISCIHKANEIKYPSNFNKALFLKDLHNLKENLIYGRTKLCKKIDHRLICKDERAIENVINLECPANNLQTLYKELRIAHVPGDGMSNILVNLYEFLK